ncbi:hypothetical protein [Microbacterium sp. LWH11-1.2]|uniref:hypothetical protein n=1 Tax=Microbacterium sp. LWH11-1.2 TaxID=3135258 RepID=UPI003139FF64
MFNWGTLGEEKFNRAAEMVIKKSVESNDPGVEVSAIDGRGGDGGIDLDVRVRKTGKLIAIYQLKHFPEGFSGEWAKTRKEQIRKSFRSALEHDPDVWYLVIPRNFTTKERQFVTSLRDHKPRPRTRRVGVAELDLMLAPFPELEEYINRDAHLAALKIVGRESALLSKPSDLRAEAELLQKRIAARSAHWGVSFTSTADTFTQEFVPLRADSAEKEPLSFSLVTDFTDKAGLGEEFRNALDYGLLESLELPADVVAHFELNGPEWFAEVINVLGLRIVPLGEELRVPVKVKLHSATDKTIAQPNAAKARVSTGTKGAQLNLTVVPGVEFTFLFDKELAESGSLRFQVALRGLTGTEAKRALKFLSSLAEAKRMSLEIGDERPFSLQFKEENPPPHIALIELADDLASIEDELGVHFVFPEESPENWDRIWIRIVRGVLEGHAYYLPGVEDLGAVVEPPLNDGLGKWLTERAGSFGLIIDDWEWEVLGQQLIIDEVTFAVFHGHVADGDAHRKALEEEPASPRTVHFVPNEANGGVVIFSPSRRKDPNQPLIPEVWGITGIPEHRFFAKRAGADAVASELQQTSSDDASAID